MARKVRRKVKADAEGGTVTVSKGITFTANFNSQRYDVGVTVPIPEGQTPDAMLEAVQAAVDVFFQDNAGKELDTIDRLIQERKRGKR